MLQSVTDTLTSIGNNQTWWPSYYSYWSLNELEKKKIPLFQGLLKMLGLIKGSEQHSQICYVFLTIWWCSWNISHFSYKEWWQGTIAWPFFCRGYTDTSQNLCLTRNFIRNRVLVFVETFPPIRFLCHEQNSCTDLDMKYEPAINLLTFSSIFWVPWWLR